MPFNVKESSLILTDTLCLLHRKNTKHDITVRDRLEGPRLTICVDCKDMVLQVIRAQSTARRLKLAKSLFDGSSNENGEKSPSNADVWGEEFY